MGMIKYPYELSVWKEELNGTNKKIESKGVIIGAHDMSYLGKATSITLTRKLNGTNTLTFSMPDKYFDSLTGEYIHNELIDVLSPESKIKLHYKDRWYEFFIKKTDEKKVFKSYMKTFSCTDAFIDELSRNGYGITFDTELYNNVEELGTFTEEVLEDSIWMYAPQYNWGDFTEFKEEKLFKIPVSQFSQLTGYKMNFRLSEKQLTSFEDQEITNVTTGDKRPIVLSDDIARNCFWDQRGDIPEDAPDNPLKNNLVKDIVNDGYIYVPYSCLNFCYGSDEPKEGETIAYDRAATEIALNYPETESLAIAPSSVDPRTLIQFYAIPEGSPIEIDDAGVILDTDYCYFMTLRQWNENIKDNNWYFFEDTRLVNGEVLGSTDLKDVNIRHTYRYIKNDNNVLDTPKEALGNKCLIYEGYLSDVNNVNIIKGKKFSITDRTEINISEDIDQYVTVYNNFAQDFAGDEEYLYTSDTWSYDPKKEDIQYRVCSKIETRQIVPQLARNLVQNGIKMDSEDGWSPMIYDSGANGKITMPSIKLKTIRYSQTSEEGDSIDDTALLYSPSKSSTGYEKYVTFNANKNIKDAIYKFQCNSEKIEYSFSNLPAQVQGCLSYLQDQGNGTVIYQRGKDFFIRIDKEQLEKQYNNHPEYRPILSKEEYNGFNIIYIKLFTQQDDIYKTLLSGTDPYMSIESPSGGEVIKYEYMTIDNNGEVPEEGIYYYFSFNNWVVIKEGNVYKFQDKEVIRPANEKLSYEVKQIIKDSDNSIINFGIVGQQKTIEKDKIYCLGIGCLVNSIVVDPFTAWLNIPQRLEEATEQKETNLVNFYNAMLMIDISPVIYDHGIGREAKLNTDYLSELTKDKKYDNSWNNLILNLINSYNDLEIYKSIDQPYQIKIGKGKLIQDGQYQIDEENALIFDATNFQYNVEDFVNTFDFDSTEILTDDLVIETLPKTNFIFFKSNKTIENPYILLQAKKKVLLFELYLFEAYTKGRDNFSENNLRYKYSGRDLFWPVNNTAYEIANGEITDSLSNEEARSIVIFEDDIMLGSTYAYQHYFIQRLKARKINEDKNITYTYYDTTGAKSFIGTKNLVTGQLPLDEADYTMDDCEVETNYIDLNKCKWYNKEAGIEDCDCKYNNGEHLCFYQRFGYCPYRFEAEKHDRRVRTLSISKSNRFNIIQQESKVFEVYPQFYIQHNENGTVKIDKDIYLKQVYFITEKGSENKIGFRYEKNLKDISRNIASDQIVTKLYVLDVDSELSKTGLCSIKTAEDNPSADSYIIDLSYYIAQGMLDGDIIEQDLYGIYPINSQELDENTIPSGFLRQLGYYNKRYDELTNNIINLQDASYTELEANLTINLEGIITAQEQILKIKKQIENYKSMYDGKGDATLYQNQATYKNYLSKLHEQEAILSQLIHDTFFTNDKPSQEQSSYFSYNGNLYKGLNEKLNPDVGGDWRTIVDTNIPMQFFEIIDDFVEIQKSWVDNHVYDCGILGQFNKEYLQIQSWKRERASYLKLINQISSAFYKKYEPYLKEGTWSDSNYLTDNAYYFGALDVAAQGAIPKVTYNISVIDISQQNELYEEVYEFDLADTTYVEDIGMFGVDKHTGLPNKLKVLISEVSENPDDQSKNSIKVQNFTTQFEDIFQQVTASVQSLTFNENIYKRSSNFTSLQNISNKSLQGALDTNDLTLLDTDENNITVDNNGTSGSDINNHANKYKLNGQGLYFSNDGGQHWSVGVGPKGINADYIKVGNLDAGKIRIADSSYVYFSWDKNGIVAYRDPAGINTDTNNINDMAIFNRYGLSVVKDGRIKLRAGYAYNKDSGGILGEIDAETEQSEEIGFYLFNNTGDVIFQTTQDDLRATGARLSLIGEMFVSSNITNTSSASDSYAYWDGYSIEERSCKKLGNSNSLDWDPVIGGQGSQTKMYRDPIGTEIDINGAVYKKQSMDGGESKYGYYGDNIYQIIFYTVDLIQMDTSVEPHVEIPDTTIQKYVAKITSNENKDYICTANLEESPKKIYKDYIAGPIEIQDANDKFPSVGQTHVYNVTSPRYSQGYKIPYFIQQPPNDSGMLYNDTRSGISTPIHWTQSKVVYGGSGVAGAVALYLNDSTINGKDDKERLFVSCKNAGTEVRNIFSILKGGQLYIGGKIIRGAENGVEKLEDKIEIEGAGIYINAEDGKLTMDFSRLYDTQGQSLTNQLGGKASGGHCHQIYGSDNTAIQYFNSNMGSTGFDIGGDTYTGDTLLLSCQNLTLDKLAQYFNDIAISIWTTYITNWYTSGPIG